MKNSPFLDHSSLSSLRMRKSAPLQFKLTTEMSAPFNASALPHPHGEERAELTARKNPGREQVHVYQNQRLRELAKSDSMFRGLENFILADPERQIEDLETSKLVSEAEQAERRGDSAIGRADYETAAKIAIYNLNKQDAQRYLGMAHKVTTKEDEHYQFQQTLLNNLDEVLQVSSEYYRTVPRAHLDNS